MDPQLQKLGLSAASACVAEFATYPPDVLKTRQQLNTTTARNSTLRNTIHIMRRQGISSVYAGISPALLRHIPYTSIRIFTFETIKSTSTAANNKNSTTATVNSDQNNTLTTATTTLLTTLATNCPLCLNLAAGMLAGALGQTIASPADLIKVRMQSDGKLPIHQRRYKSIAHAFSLILKTDGVAGLWRGSLPAVQRAALVNLGELSTYSAAKQAVLQSGITDYKDNLYTHLLSSMCSGLVASVVSTPADVVKSRLMNQDPNKPVYRGMLHCFRETYKGEGVRGLYKGFLPTWARLGPWQLTFWVSFEQMRKLSGLQPF